MKTLLYVVTWMHWETNDAVNLIVIKLYDVIVYTLRRVGIGVVE